MNTLYKEYRSCGYIDTKSLAVPAAPSYWVRAENLHCEIYIVQAGFFTNIRRGLASSAWV